MHTPREHVERGNPIYLRAPDGYRGTVMRLHPDGRREIVWFDFDTGRIVVEAELEPMNPSSAGGGNKNNSKPTPGSPHAELEPNINRSIAELVCSS